MGAENIATLFNGEFYEQIEDPAHAKAIGVGKGCYIDQVIGQFWANQVGLGRHLRRANTRSPPCARCGNTTSCPNTARFRKDFKQGRLYAMPGDAGLLMCTWPKGGLRAGFQETLAIRLLQRVHDRLRMAGRRAHGPGRRDDRRTASRVAARKSADPRAHRAASPSPAPSMTATRPRSAIPTTRSSAPTTTPAPMASYSLFLAACGFSYNGPAGVIGFDPKVGPDDFKAPFTAAEGWGSFEQKKPAGKPWSARSRWPMASSC